MASILTLQFLCGFLTCLALWGLVALLRRSRSVWLKPGVLAYTVQIDGFNETTWNVGYPTLAEVPLQLCDCGRTVRYAGKMFRIERFNGGTEVPILKSLR